MADGIIPSTQGFWVRATSTSASITIPQSQRMFSDQAFYKGGALAVNESIRLRVDGNNDFDVLMIQFIPGSTDGYDAMFDLEKRWGYDEAPQLYAIMDETEYLSVNALPAIEENMVIPLGFKVGMEGTYKIVSAEFANFREDQEVILEDLQTNSFTRIVLDSEYEFSASPIDKEHRFNLHFKSSSLEPDDDGLQAVRIYSSEQTVYIQTPDNIPAEVTIFDIMGREVAREQTNGDTIFKINLTTKSGYYLVQVKTNDQFITKKVFIK
jgi:hypothetical protein